MVKTMKKKPQPTRSNKKYPPEFRSEALKLAEKIGVAEAARQLSLYESQIYGWRSAEEKKKSTSARETELATENARLKRQLAAQAEEIEILKKFSTYLAKQK